MATKVLVWGIGKEFWQLYNILKLNEAVGNIEIVGYVDKEENKKHIDGKEVFSPNNLVKSEIIYDYVIVTTGRYYKEISVQGSMVLGIERRKFLNGKILLIPYFSWNEYLNIYEKNISIIAESCAGGILSNNLGLPFCSPFVNMRVGIEKNDYYKLLKKLDDYMCQSPTEYSELTNRNYNWNGWEGRIDFPKLWYEDILLHGFHYSSQKNFYENWEKRRKRYNSKNKVILKILYDEEDVENFKQIMWTNKIGFYSKKIETENIISITHFNLCDSYAYQYASYVYDFIKSGEIFRYVNVFRLLNGENDWKIE